MAARSEKQGNGNGRGRADRAGARPGASPYSTWIAVGMVLPGAAVVVALILTTGQVLAWYAAAVNLTVFLLYWQDKSAARKNVGRVPEFVLHLLAAMGGTPAALLAQRLFRHKTRKWKFQAIYWTTVAAHLVVAAWGASRMISAGGWQGPMWTAFAVGVLAAVNVATFVIEPMRRTPRLRSARLVLLTFGGGCGAAFRDQRGDGVGWLPYLAATAQLGAAITPALVQVRALIGG